MNIITECLIIGNEVSTQFRRQNQFVALGKLRELSEKLTSFIQGIIGENATVFPLELDVEYIVSILSGIMSAQENKDYILVADLIELQLVPWMQQVQQALIAIEDMELKQNVLLTNLKGLKETDSLLAKQIESFELQKQYVLEPTSSGLLTLQVTDETGTYYFHSNNNPVVEASVFADQYYSMDCSCYLVFGLGLGYHIKALLNLDDGLYIDIIEPDMNVIKAAALTTDMDWLYQNPRVRLFYDKDFIKMKELLGMKKQLIIHYPSVRHIANAEIKLQMEKFFIRDSGKRNFAIQFRNNFRDNIKNCHRYIDEIRDKFEGKNAIIVAAGPSLDTNVELLRSRPNNTVIVAVGTVFSKLLSLGITPDYVIFLDAQPRLYQQVAGLENSTVPIICASTACKKIAAQYTGEKFLICQYGYEQAEEYANKNGYELYKTGGSVSTIALDMCIRLRCKEIAFVGLDLAYTNNRSHAVHTADYKLSDEENKILIPAINGGMVYASRVFIMYREWIERRVEEELGKVVVIDATEGGALKKHMPIMSLEEVYKKWKKDS